MSSGLRVRILCEDTRSERFLVRLCKARGVAVVDVEKAPKADGSASAWVLARYPLLVRQRRSKNFQQNLGLLVHIDGDDVGVTARKAALDQRLAALSIPPRDGAERIALLVPTWCVETWLLHLGAIAQPPETAKLKRDPDPTWRPALRQLEATEATAIQSAVAAWSTASTPASVIDGRAEARRVGIT